MDRVWGRAVTAGIAGLFGFVSLWIIFEQDIFWQIRAGYELLQTHVFPHVDTWSYSAYGEPWLNIQWLATILLYAGYAVRGIPSLVAMRGLLVALLFVCVGASVLRATRRASGRPSIWALFVLMPLVYVALLPRLQLRSDSLVLLVFAALGLLWQTAWTARSQCVGTVLCVWLAANLHAGTAPFAGVAALAYLWSRADVSRRAAAMFTVACGAAFFVTPYTYHVLTTLYEHFFYYDYNVLQNADQLPLDARYFEGGAIANAWLCVCGAALGEGLCMWRTAPVRDRQFWQRHAPVLLACALLTYMCVNRVRSIPYQVLFLLPFAARALQRLHLPATLKAAVATAAVTMWLVTAGSMASMRGWGVHEGLYPVGSAAFIERERPQPNVFHTFACGAYLVWYMRDYPLYVDTRETMYRGLQQEVIASFFSPEITQGLVRKYHVETMLFPIPPTRYTAEGTFEDVIARFLPHEEWAVVYFDKASFVALKRIPEHAALIAKNEYTLLRPNLPANLYALSKTRTPASDAVFAREIARCRANEPDNVYCLTAEAAFLSTTDAQTYARVAVGNLERARQTAERWNSPQLMTVLVELRRAYSRTGDTVRAQALGRRLGLKDGV